MDLKGPEGSTATTHSDVLEVRARLDQLRSFIRWTAPLYALFLVAGLLATQFAFQSPLVLLLAILAAFAGLDGVVLNRIHRLEAAPLDSDGDLRTTRIAIERLSRIVFLAGTGLGAVFLVLLAWMILRP